MGSRNVTGLSFFSISLSLSLFLFTRGTLFKSHLIEKDRCFKNRLLERILK